MYYQDYNIKKLQEKIRALLEEKNAILLVHNYERPEIQDIADLCGDSLELSIKASKTEADVIVFCGVHFMAETAAILSPQKTVLLPAVAAGCPMADMITAEALTKKRREAPDAVVVSYVNTRAAVKAESDICCTSANAVHVVNSIEHKQKIYMIPDKNLAQYTKKQTLRDVNFWKGYCPVHDHLSVDQVKKVKAAYPSALFLAHPECPPEVLEMADEVKSTSGMIVFATASYKREFIIGTETGIIHRLSKANPDKVFISADPNMICPDMKKIGLEDILKALQDMSPEVKVPENIRVRAKQAVDSMLAIPRY